MRSVVVFRARVRVQSGSVVILKQGRFGVCEGSNGTETRVAVNSAKGRLRCAVDAWAAAGARPFAETLERRIMLDSTVVFNEIMYNPAGTGATSDSQEWIELYNQLGVDVDLSGWCLRSGVDYTFP